MRYCCLNKLRKCLIKITFSRQHVLAHCGACMYVLIIQIDNISASLFNITMATIDDYDERYVHK